MYENVVISAVAKQIQMMDDFRAAMLSIDMIRPHIPTEADKESTAPKPNVTKLRAKKTAT